MTNTNESIEQIKDLGNRSYASMQELAELNLRTWEKLLGRQMEAFSFMMDTSIRQVKLVSETKGYNELVKGQVELNKELSERLLEESRNNIKLANESRDEYRTLMEKGVSEISAQMKQTA